MNVAVQQRSFGAWDSNLSDDLEVMPSNVVEKALSLIERWEPHFPLGETWVGKEHGVPSLFIRIDCVVTPSGDLMPFEVEERPCGIGMARETNPFFAERFDALRATWPAFTWVKSPTRETDDPLWLGEPTPLEEALESDGLVLVRSRPEEAEYHPLESRSVSSVAHEGCKKYGVALGLWDEIRVVQKANDEYEFHPPLDGPAFLKPPQGTRARSILPFIPDGNVRREKSDRVSRSQIVRAILRDGFMFRQRFIEPMVFAHQPEHNGIYRFFLGRDLSARRWVPLGGMWAASPSIIVHGTPKTIFGPLAFEE
jgi:hypothetical protein